MLSFKQKLISNLYIKNDYDFINNNKATIFIGQKAL